MHNPDGGRVRRRVLLSAAAVTMVVCVVGTLLYSYVLRPRLELGRWTRAPRWAPGEMEKWEQENRVIGRRLIHLLSGEQQKDIIKNGAVYEVGWADLPEDIRKDIERVLKEHGYFLRRKIEGAKITYMPNRARDAERPIHIQGEFPVTGKGGEGKVASGYAY